MIAVLFLTVYVVVAGTLGATLLAGARWTQAAPRWGVGAWQVLSVSVVLAGLLAAPALAMCLLPVRTPVAELLGLSPLEVARHYEPVGGDWVGVMALAVATTVAGVILTHTAGNLRHAASVRREHLATLALVGRPHPGGYTVLDHRSPVIYCLPGRGRTVVVSSGALDLLTPSQLQLVLQHERSHLRARHDLALAFSEALSKTCPVLPIFRVAHRQIAMLVEMQADDAVKARGDRRSLAHAMIAISSGLRPDSVLAATGSDTAARVRRLAAPTVLVARRHKAGIALAYLALLGLPLGLALAPVIEASSTDCCEAAFSPHP